MFPVFRGASNSSLAHQDADIGLSVEIPVLTSHYFSEV